MLALLIFFLGLAQEKPKQLIAYTYDSFTGKGSLGEILKTEFEKNTGAFVKFITFGSAGEALNQIILEGERTQADILVGIDTSLLSRALAKGKFQKFSINFGQQIKFTTKKSDHWIPFDYGYPTLVYDSSRYLPQVKTIQDLSLPIGKKIALIDPRTSSLGRLFLLWTAMVIPQQRFNSFWKALAKNTLTVAPGWSGAYSLFTKREVDMTLSYTTSPAYHLHFEKTANIKALFFPEGHIRQVEGILLSRFSKQTHLANQLVETLLGKKIQNQIPLTQFMYPMLKAAVLPQEFKQLSEPKAIELDEKLDIEALTQSWLAAWMP